MFNTTVGVRQGYLLSPVLFNLFLEEIMAGIQDEHISTISTSGRNLSNLRFADDIDLIGNNKHLYNYILLIIYFCIYIYKYISIEMFIYILLVCLMAPLAKASYTQAVGHGFEPRPGH